MSAVIERIRAPTGGGVRTRRSPIRRRIESGIGSETASLATRIGTRRAGIGTEIAMAMRIASGAGGKHPLIGAEEGRTRAEETEGTRTRTGGIRIRR